MGYTCRTYRDSDQIRGQQYEAKNSGILLPGNKYYIFIPAAPSISNESFRPGYYLCHKSIYDIGSPYYDRVDSQVVNSSSSNFNVNLKVNYVIGSNSWILNFRANNYTAGENRSYKEVTFAGFDFNGTSVIMDSKGNLWDNSKTYSSPKMYGDGKYHRFIDLNKTYYNENQNKNIILVPFTLIDDNHNLYEVENLFYAITHKNKFIPYTFSDGEGNEYGVAPAPILTEGSIVLREAKR